MALKEEVEALLMRYDKKEFNLSESERLAMHQGEMTQEVKDSLLAKELLYHLHAFEEQWKLRSERLQEIPQRNREGVATGIPFYPGGLRQEQK